MSWRRRSSAAARTSCRSARARRHEPRRSWRRNSACARGEVERFERGAGGLPLGSDAELNREVFSDAVLNQRRVGWPMQLGEDRMTIFQVVEHHAAAVAAAGRRAWTSIVATLVRQRGSGGCAAAAEAGAGAPECRGEHRQGCRQSRSSRLRRRASSAGAPDLPVELRDAVFALPRPQAGKARSAQALKLEDGSVALLEVIGSRVTARCRQPAAAAAARAARTAALRHARHRRLLRRGGEGREGQQEPAGLRSKACGMTAATSASPSASGWILGAMALGVVLGLLVVPGGELFGPAAWWPSAVPRHRLPQPAEDADRAAGRVLDDRGRGRHGRRARPRADWACCRCCSTC